MQHWYGNVVNHQDGRSGHSKTSTQLIVLDSRDRFSPTEYTVGDFRIDLLPKDGTVTALTLKHASFPFAFRNVTDTYGHQLLMRVYPDRTLPGNFIIPIDVNQGYYSIGNLMAAINAQISTALTSHALPWSLTLGFSVNEGMIALTTTNQSVRVVFDPTPFPVNQRYLFNMLGLSSNGTSTIDGFDLAGVYSLNFPYFATQELPFKGIMISLDCYPDDVFTTNRVSALFIVPIHGYNSLETLLSNANHSTAHGIQWNENNQFTQRVELEQSLGNLQTVRVRLYDNRGNPLTEHFQENDFILVIQVDKNKIF